MLSFHELKESIRVQKANKKQTNFDLDKNLDGKQIDELG